MPFIEITVPPGVLKSESDYAAAGRWIDMDHVRFSRGKPEKIGGVIKLDSAIEAFDGIARAAEAWASYTGVQCLAFGTACNLYIYRGAELLNITPFRPDATGITLAVDPFSVTDTSAIVTVTDVNHGIEAAGTVVVFSGATAGGGITINGSYTVTSIVDEDHYTITHSAAATSTDATTGGAAVLASYEINCGNVSPEYTEDFGWGVGGWGEGYWGVLTSFGSLTLSEAMTWALDVYGEDLLVNPLNSGLYLYDTSIGGRPGIIANAPTQVRSAFVTEERYIFALGCTTGAGTFDPMTVRWPDILDITIWTPADTNRANERKLQGGTRLMAGARLSKGTSVIWSDSDCFEFQFTGGSTVYSSRSVGTRCGLVGQQAHIEVDGVAYWMSFTSFHMYHGVVQEIPKVDEIKDYVFHDISELNMSKSFAFYNPIHNEIWFVYPSAAATEPDRYVAVSLKGEGWIHGTWDRSAGANYTVGEKRPVLFGTNGYIYLHDVQGNTNNDGDVLEAFIELAPTDVDGGNTLVDIWGVIPDCQRQTGDLEVYFYGLDHPRDGPINEDTITVSPTDAIGDIRSGGRQFGMRITSNTDGGDFRLGRWGIEAASAGKKRGSQVA